jgi:hypothetical protein
MLRRNSLPAILKACKLFILYERYIKLKKSNSCAEQDCDGPSFFFK